VVRVDDNYFIFLCSDKQPIYDKKIREDTYYGPGRISVYVAGAFIWNARKLGFLLWTVHISLGYKLIICILQQHKY